MLYKKPLNFVIGLTWLLSSAGIADSASETKTSSTEAPAIVVGHEPVHISAKESRKIRVLLGTDLVVFKDHINQTRKGLGFQATFLLGMSDSWQLGVTLHEANQLTSPRGILFFALDARADLALTGSMPYKASTTSINDRDQVTISGSEGGLRLAGFVSQYFPRFGGSSGASTGIGASLYYEFASPTSTNFFVGARFDRFSNSSGAYYPMQVSFGISLWP